MSVIFMSHVMLAGPFTVLPDSARPHQRGAAQEDDEGVEPAEQQEPDLAAGGGGGSTLVTHLAPPGLRRSLEHSTKAFHLALGLFESFLGAKFPFPSLHQVRVRSVARHVTSSNVMAAVH